jgi:hypothetical protein
MMLKEMTKEATKSTGWDLVGGVHSSCGSKQRLHHLVMSIISGIMQGSVAVLQQQAGMFNLQDESSRLRSATQLMHSV